MADQVFNISCGFFDAVNHDRTYTASEMCMPYKRFVTDGILYGDDGLPGTDFLVEAVSGMNIKVNPGNGMFDSKWFELASTLAITVPDNTGLSSRSDYVILQVDRRIEGRTGNVIYREGSGASTADQNVIEYEVAQISVPAGATEVGTIVDLRGTRCPWATSKVQPLDHVIMLPSHYETTSETAEIPIMVSGYVPETDYLMVYINGVYADPSRYSIVTEQYEIPKISLTNALPSGQSVDFLCVHNYYVEGSGLDNISRYFDTVNNNVVYLWGTVYSDVEALKHDSDWSVLAPTGSIRPYSPELTTKVRKFGNMVHIRGAVKNLTDSDIGTAIFNLPQGYAPSRMCHFTTSFVNASNAAVPVAWSIDTSGHILLDGISDSVLATDMIPIDTSFILD